MYRPVQLCLVVSCLALWGCSDDPVTPADSGVDLSVDVTPADDKGVGIEIGTTKPDLGAPQKDQAPPQPDKGQPPQPDKGTPPQPDKGQPPQPDKGSPVADALPSSCTPYCDKIGTKSEGWYDGCTKKLITYFQCAKCKAVCKDCGLGCKGNGWYDSCNAKVIQYTTCTNCKPKCGNIGSKSEGWVDGCKGGLLTKPGSSTPFWDQCAKCKAVCKHFNTYSMGFYSSCTNALIQYTTCIP